MDAESGANRTRHSLCKGGVEGLEGVLSRVAPLAGEVLGSFAKNGWNYLTYGTTKSMCPSPTSLFDAIPVSAASQIWMVCLA